MPFFNGPILRVHMKAEHPGHPIPPPSPKSLSKNGRPTRYIMILDESDPLKPPRVRNRPAPSVPSKPTPAPSKSTAIPPTSREGEKEYIMILDDLEEPRDQGCPAPPVPSTSKRPLPPRKQPAGKCIIVIDDSEEPHNRIPPAPSRSTPPQPISKEQAADSGKKGVRCLHPGCVSVFKTSQQLSRHRWTHIPKEAFPRCIGIKNGFPCDHMFNGRVDVMRGHWEKYHNDQGQFPGSLYSYGSVVRAMKYEHDKQRHSLQVPPLSQEGGLFSVSPPSSCTSSSLHSSEFNNDTMDGPLFFGEANMELDETLFMQDIQFTAPVPAPAPLWNDGIWDMQNSHISYNFY